MTWLLIRWSILRVNLRRIPLLDLVQGVILILWGVSGLLNPTGVVYRSHFGSLAAAISLASAISLLAGIAQSSIALTRWERGRTIASFVCLWVMISLWFSVNSLTGKIAWGAHAFLELLICLALVP